MIMQVRPYPRDVSARPSPGVAAMKLVETAQELEGQLTLVALGEARGHWVAIMRSRVVLRMHVGTTSEPVSMGSYDPNRLAHLPLACPSQAR